MLSVAALTWMATWQALREMIGRLQVAHNYAADTAAEQITAGMAALNTGDVVSSFLCPITQEVMTDPVLTSDGYTYERDAIEHWYVTPISACVSLILVIISAQARLPQYVAAFGIASFDA